jgi:hypothetical protein
MFHDIPISSTQTSNMQCHDRPIYSVHEVLEEVKKDLRGKSLHIEMNEKCCNITHFPCRMTEDDDDDPTGIEELSFGTFNINTQAGTSFEHSCLKDFILSSDSFLQEFVCSSPIHHACPSIHQ